MDPYVNDIARTLALNLSATSSSEDVIASLRNMNLGDDFWMYSFKVVPCAKSFSHKWTLCPCAHAGETARRRDPRFVPYRAVPCPLLKVKKNCPMGDNCMYSHNVFEHWLHPSRYKTRLCSFGRNCSRPICFFAHSADELRCAPPADEAKDVDEREYLMQVVMGQEPGPHNHHAQTNQMQQHPGSMMPGGGNIGPGMHRASLDGMMLSMQAAGLGQHQQHSGQPQQQGPRSRASSSGIPSQHQQHQHQRYQPPPQQLQHQQQYPPQSQNQGQSQGQGQSQSQGQQLAGLDATSLLLGLQESLASLNLSEHSWAAGAGGAHSRISDPGTSNPHINPIRHLNRISDSGQTLGLATPGGIASLESLLTSALAGAMSMPSQSSSPSAPQPPQSPRPSSSGRGEQGEADGHGFAAAAADAQQAPPPPRGPAQSDADAYVKDLVAQLQQQGIATTKEQLVITLSQLLAQLLVTS